MAASRHGRLILAPGQLAKHRGTQVEIKAVVDLETILVEAPESGATRSVKISELRPAGPEVEVHSTEYPDLENVDPKDIKIAEERFSAISDLVDQPGRTRSDVAECASKYGKSVATLYRWLNDYEATGRLAALLPKQVSKSRGQTRLDSRVEELLQKVVDEYFLTPRQPKLTATWERLRLFCHRAKLPAPHLTTLRARILSRAPEERLRRRKGRKAADDHFRPHQSKFPGADHPLSVVQIDHTLLNCIIVDDEYREAIGKPWLTLAIDVFSSAITGLYLTLDSPSADSVGVCLSRSFLPKESWLASLDVENQWPVWGIPEVIHADNAKEFRGRMLRLAELDFGFRLEWRPVRTPRYGAHVERMCGTLKWELENLPGRVNRKEGPKEAYDANRSAALTLKELETWLVQYITGVYHERIHSSHGVTPLSKFEEGIFGTEETPGVGLPEIPADFRRVQLSLLPCDHRTVQQYGIMWDGLCYYAEALNPWINSPDPSNPKSKRKFLVRRDPKDVSVIYFYDPEVDQYFDIPLRNPTRPSVTLWEVRAAQRRLRDKGVQIVDEAKIFEAREELLQLETRAKRRTTSARRSSQRRRSAQTTLRSLGRDKTVEKPNDEHKVGDIFSEDITSFNDGV